MHSAASKAAPWESLTLAGESRDIQANVENLADPPLPARIVSADLVWLKDITQDHHLPEEELTKHCATGPQVNCHIREVGRFNQQYALLSRDYLRKHKYASQAYGEVKLQMAKLFPTDVEAYYDVKDPVFDVMMEEANVWIQQTKRKPGCSDA